MPLPDAAWRPLARPLRGKVRVDDPEPVDPFLQPTCGWWFPNWYVAQGAKLGARVTARAYRVRSRARALCRERP